MKPVDSSGSQRGDDSLLQLLKRDIRQRTLWYIFLVLVAIIFAAILLAALSRVQTGKLTLTEQILIQFSLVFLGAILAWLIAKRDEERNILSKQKALAKGAVRRIIGISRSAARHRNLLRGAVREVSDESGLYRMSKAQKTLLLEKLSLFEQQLAELRDTIEDSIGDWRDILPEEFEKVQEFNRTVSEAQEEMSEQLEKVRAEIEQKGEEESKKREELNERFAESLKKFEERLGRKWSELQPFDTYMGVYPSGVISSSARVAPPRFSDLGGVNYTDYWSWEHTFQPVRKVVVVGTPKEQEESKSREQEQKKKRKG